MAIVGNDADRWRFLKLLLYMNDVYLDENWEQTVGTMGFLERPDFWPEREPLVHILAFTLMTNHLHLLVKEIRQGGVSLFMKRLGQSMTNHHNGKHKQSGSLFQGSFRSKTIDSDEYLRYVAAYVMVKNTFELFSNIDFAKNIYDFESAWEWATTYPFSSLGEYANIRTHPIVEKDVLGEIYTDPIIFKSFSKEVLLGGEWKQFEFE